MTLNCGCKIKANELWEPCDEHNAGRIADAVSETSDTLRDEFAKAALVGMLAHSRGNPPHGYKPVPNELYWHNAIAIEAYELADAMLKARNR
jgi:hypothetical protein